MQFEKKFDIMGIEIGDKERIKERDPMNANKLVLKNFRNFEELELDFRPGLTVISGHNGAGKTNILEALYMCSIGRSPRTRQDGLLITKGKGASQTTLHYTRAGISRSVGVHLSATKGKTVVLDGTPSGKISEIVGNFACVYFSPEEVNIVRGGPQYRRRFMDIINCQINPGYMNALKNLQHCIKQRNALLRGIKMANVYDHSLDPWDAQIVAFSTKIMLRRATFVHTLQRIVDGVMRILTDNRESLRLNYRSFSDRLDRIHVNYIADEYYRKAHQNYVKDVLTHTSSVGPHLDDIDIRLVYLNNKNPASGKSGEEPTYINLRNEGSLGQQRTATLALKIAETYFYHKYYGERPVLLLDDVLSELDFVRRRKLMEYCSHYDTIVTCTEWSYENVKPDTWFEVTNGKVEEHEVSDERFSYQGELDARAREFAKGIEIYGDSFITSKPWLKPVQALFCGDTPRTDEKPNFCFPEEQILKIFDEQEAQEKLENNEFDIWDDEGQPIKRPTTRKK